MKLTQHCKSAILQLYIYIDIDILYRYRYTHTCLNHRKINHTSVLLSGDALINQGSEYGSPHPITILAIVMSSADYPDQLNCIKTAFELEDILNYRHDCAKAIKPQRVAVSSYSPKLVTSCLTLSKSVLLQGLEERAPTSQLGDQV